MATQQSTAAGPPGRDAGPLRQLLPLGVGAAIGLAVYAATQIITPDSSLGLFGQSPGPKTFDLKAWLATGVLALAAFQLSSALWIYGRLPFGRKPRWLGGAHRASGVTAIVLSLPIAYNCLLAYGFRDLDNRTLVHSLAGCAFYGAFAAKVIVVRSKRLPGWQLPVAGGVLVTLVVVLWYSAALWDFNNFHVPGLSPSTPKQSSSAGAGAAGGSGYGAPAGGSGYGAPAGGAGAPAAGAVVGVTYKDYSIAPETVNAKVGQTVRWTNADSAIHNVTGQSGPATFTSPDMKQGATYEFKALKPGTYHYQCTFHPATMNGTIVVAP